MASSQRKSSRGSDLSLQIEQPEDSDELNMILYGETGVGKTLLAGTAADCEDMAPVLYMDFEGGTQTLRGIDVEIVRPRDWKDIQEVYDFLREGNDKYQTVILDSLTELQSKHSMGTQLMQDKAVKQKLDIAEMDYYDDLEHVSVPDRQDWLRTRMQMIDTIRAFRDLAYLPNRDDRINVIMTALEKFDEKKQAVCPQLSGLLGLECGAYVDILARLSIQNVVLETDEEDEETEESTELPRHLLVSQHIDALGVSYKAKTRGGRLGKQFWNPTMQDIIERWQDG